MEEEHEAAGDELESLEVLLKITTYLLMHATLINFSSARLRF
jgi:hypothetical protein